MKEIKKTQTSVIMSVALVFTILITTVLTLLTNEVNAESVEYTDNVNVYVDGELKGSVRALHYDYLHNVYLSVRDIAVLLKDTQKNFEFSISTRDDETCYVFETGKNYGETGGEGVPFENTLEVINNARKKILLSVDGNDKYFYVIPGKNSAGTNDCFMFSGELAVALNLNMYFEGGELYIDTAKDFDLQIENLFDSDFFQFATGSIVGDATTGEIYYSFGADKSLPIASTTKLMTYLVIMDAVKSGEISDKDMITFSAEASRISNTSDGVVAVKEGQKAPFDEVVKAMLIKSSNECALALAEHLSGTEEKFVKRMELKASELGLSDQIRFFNSNGLPVYMDDVINTKVQNRMTANDMFIIASEILKKHPEVTQITSIKETFLESLNLKVKNTNVLLHNIPNVVGLKTGTTAKAKSCLVTAMEKTDDYGNVHYIVSVEFGAEDAQVQSFGSMILLKYAEMSFDSSKKVGEEETEKPSFPDTVTKLYDALLMKAMIKAESKG